MITGGRGALAQAAAQALMESGMEVSFPSKTELDVRDEDKVARYFAELGNLDLLVCNAGITDDHLLLKMSEESWDSVLDVNLRGAFLVAKEAAKMMVRQRCGHLVFISSYSAFHPPVGQANYAASKAALIGLAKSLAQELGSRNIRVNVVIPGFMETKMTSGLAEDVRISAMEKHTLSRFNTTEATGKFLRCLHFEMQHTSGQVFNLDSRIL